MAIELYFQSMTPKELSIKASGLGLALILAYLIFHAIYDVFFHPLRTFPGPPLARVSMLWSRIGNLQGRKCERIHQAHLEYGKIDRRTSPCSSQSSEILH